MDTQYIPAGIIERATTDVGSGKTKLETGHSNFELTAAQKQDIQEAFRVFDPEGTGYMDVKDLKVRMIFQTMIFLLVFWIVHKQSYLCV